MIRNRSLSFGKGKLPIVAIHAHQVGFAACKRHVCLAGAVANVADSDRCRCNPKVPSSIPAGGKDFP